MYVTFSKSEQLWYLEIVYIKEFFQSVYLGSSRLETWIGLDMELQHFWMNRTQKHFTIIKHGQAKKREVELEKYCNKSHDEVRNSRVMKSSYETKLHKMINMTNNELLTRKCL